MAGREGKTIGDVLTHLGETLDPRLHAMLSQTRPGGYEHVIYEFYSLMPEFLAIEARLKAVSKHANRVVVYIKMHFEWKGGWLKPGGFMNALGAYRKHFRAMPEPPALVEDLAWDLLQTKYWQAYFFLHDRTLPSRHEFQAHFFDALVHPRTKKSLQEKRQPAIREVRMRQARTLREERKLANRFVILQRDRFRCRLCGVAASDGEYVRLEVDHIIPRSKGGKDHAENKWTLCFECNRGKGTRFI